MGANLTPIMVKQTFPLQRLRGKKLAVDANNYLYQFLSIVRTKDGTSLKDSTGNITSHLAGLMFRSTRLMLDFNMDLIFVFDGQPPELKREEIARRRKQRDRALQEMQNALREADYVRAFSKAVSASRLTRSMIEDAKKLLTLLGIPHIQAPSEAEAQTAHMAIQGDVWAASSKDYDTLLFGAPRMLRFLTLHGKEFLPSKGTTRPLKPELITLSELLSHHKISRPQLIDLAILVGTDYNDGIKGVGPKTALKLIKEYGRIENMPDRILSEVSPRYKRVRETYLDPKVTPQYNTSLGSLREEELYHFLCKEREFARERVETVVKRMRKIAKMTKQTEMGNWMEISTDNS